MSEAWAWEKDFGFDETGHQRKEACLAVAWCPKCGEEVECVAETEAWHREGDRWVHAEYGPATGWCCGLAIIDSFEGCIVLDLTEVDGG